MKVIKRKTKERIHIKLSILFCVFLFYFNACTTYNIENTLKSNSWYIDTMLYRDVAQDLYYNVLSCVSPNVIYFKKQNKLYVYDLAACEDMFKWDNEGIWKIVRTDGKIPYHLQIESNNEVLNGTHKMWFCKDEKKNLIKLVLFSEKLYLVASYGRWSYNINSPLFNSLIKATGCYSCDAAYQMGSVP